MNKEEYLKDLSSLSAQKLQVEGAMNYIVQKLKELEKIEKEKLEEEKERLE